MKKTLVVVGSILALGCGDETNEKGPIQINNPTQNNTAGQNNPVGQNNPMGQNNPVSSNNTTGQNNVDDLFCPESARPIYAVEADVENPGAQGTLVRFDAPTLAFAEIGQLNCPIQDATPFSMSVDRAGVAWVLYDSGDLFKVSTADASCEATSYIPGQSGFWLFGMGFTLDRPGFPEETLYIAGSDGPGSGTPRLGTLSFPDFGVTSLATIGGWPEMSGTAEGELWAFFPGNSPPEVARLSRNGQVLESISIDGIDGEPNAWAFAHWGGKFWLFYKSQADTSTRVFQVDREPINVEEVISDSGRYIVGAGVSTCAPTIFL